MIPCPNCGHDKNTVREAQSKTNKIRRYRICKKCGKSFTTEEFLAVFAGQSRGLVVDRPPGEADG